MASESRLYTFSNETKAHLRKFRLGTSRSNHPQAIIYMIDRNTLEIKQDKYNIVYTNLEELGDELPDHSPRFVLLSYPLTLPSGRISVPYVLLYYLPVTCNSELKMLYAGAKELVRNTAEVGKVLEIDSTDDLDDLPQRLGAA
ncbi:Actin-depolymerizing factor gmf1 [Erysiphe necator]|uniref:Putative gmf family protein n=1 Tax=Uncinula necator TaxID=52586 RepID=A0A0B1PAZ0_UNCNE|nr:Actin-depolymerizing factor gmf1 [Erysiphe necator]KHJ35842.1 putative gmf family protein [Erysiphe necator]